MGKKIFQGEGLYNSAFFTADADDKFGRVSTLFLVKYDVAIKWLLKTQSE